MNWRWIYLYLLIAFVRSSSQKDPSATSYVAAVVEFAPKLTPNESASECLKMIAEAKREGAEIVVFPEDFITTYDLPDTNELDNWTTVIPPPEKKISPCTEHYNGVSQTLKDISCSALAHKIYVVVNLAEKLPCNEKNCTKKVYYYNSNIVLDRNGTIIARYRKVNLFHEKQFDVTREPEIVTFDTDFGVRFGTFICFDILFATPPLNLTRNLGITDIVYTTAWFSETPFLTAVQTQAGWSYAEDVNLLAAGYNNPKRGSAGTGIYLGRGGIKKAIMPMNKTSMVIVAEVPKKANRPIKSKIQHSESKHDDHGMHIHDELRKKRDASSSELKLLQDDLTTFKTESLTGNVTAKQLCHNNFCCNFTIRATNMDPSMKYKMVVFNGIRSYAGIRQAATRVCAVIQCSTDDVKSCGSTMGSASTFSMIGITGTFGASLNSLIMPSTLNSSLLPLTDGWTYDEHAHDDHKHVGMYLDKMTSNLVTFGVYCRDFDRDNVNAASGILAYSFSTLMAFLLSRFL